MKWIDAKKQKPTLGKDVLVWLKTHTYNPDHYLIGYIDDEDKQWYFRDEPLEEHMFFVSH